MMRSTRNREMLTRGRGVAETVKVEWIYIIHKWAAVNDTTSTMTNLKRNKSEQHIEQMRYQRPITNTEMILSA